MPFPDGHYPANHPKLKGDSMDIFVARQPIFNTSLKTYAYELLFRDGLDNAFPDIDGDTASAKLLSNSFVSIGLENLTGGKKAFINFTQKLLINQIPTILPNEFVVVEVLEDVNPNPQVIAACRAMAQKGYEIALDDFVLYDGLKPLIRLAKLIKIDFRATPPKQIERLMDQLADMPVQYLAEKVETYDEFDLAKQMGFEYFQGYFFNKPEIIKGRGLAPTKIKLLQIIGEANRSDFDYDRLEELIKTDLSLSYQILRYINSAFFRRTNEIDSIRQAIVFLGIEEVRKILSVTATAKLVNNKPNELMRASIVRAKLCEMFGRVGGYDGNTSELFLLGLFSLMDAILDTRIETILENLPVSDQFTQALTQKSGPMACYLALACDYEQGIWEDECRLATGECRDIKVKVDEVMEVYGWADAILKIT